MTNETFEFTMKDAASSFGWLLEGATDLKDVAGMGADAWVKATAKMMISGANSGDTSDEGVYQAWLDDTDEFEQVVEFIQGKIDEMRDEQALEAVVTPKEIAEDFGVKEDTVRDAIEHGWIIARKSGATWLILRKHAEARWGFPDGVEVREFDGAWVVETPAHTIDSLTREKAYAIARAYSKSDKEYFALIGEGVHRRSDERPQSREDMGTLLEKLIDNSDL